MPEISVLVIHNRYQQPGGEDAVVRAEVADLRRRGHRVIEYTRENSEIAHYRTLRRSSLPFTTTWNSRTYAAVRSMIRKEHPDIVHIHNFFPLVSPAAHYAAKSCGVPVLQTLHNYRLSCPAATVFWNEEPCRMCCSLSAGLLRGCYRDSRTHTAVVVMMLGAHRAAGTWNRCVDAYLVPSKFCRNYFAQAGLAPHKLNVRPNFLAEDPGQRTTRGEYALFAGRLSPEKGVLEMVRAWQRIPDVPLLIAGDGPLRPELEQAASCMNSKVKLLGQLAPEETITAIKGARFLIFPSRWYEPFGMALLEATACGVPAIASGIGAVPELVVDGETGLLFDPDNFDELAGQVRWAWSHPREMEHLGDAARQLYEEKFTPDQSYEAWLNVCQALLN